MADVLLSLLNAAFYAIFLQNIILSGGFGLSEMLRFTGHRYGLRYVCALVSWGSMFTAFVCNLLTEYSPLPNALPFPLLALVFYAVQLILFALAALGLQILKAEKWLYALPVAALNSLVMAVPMLNYRLGQTLPRAIGTGLGAGVALGGAALLVRTGLEILEKREGIPAPMRGLPMSLLYTGLIALAFSGFTGSVLFV
jgi:Na+-translocating ferredoxin:NAD+ oxidoreductase RnfA subunit